MKNKSESLRKIAYDSMHSIIIITIWYLVIFYIAYSLDIILPSFEFNLVIIVGYLAKYLLLFFDVYLLFYAVKAEIQTTTHKIDKFKKEHLK